MRTILVDPPRAGLDDETLQLLRRFDRRAPRIVNELSACLHL